jgi:hypothetical protein
VPTLLWLERRGAVARGRLFAAYLLAYGLGRILLEQIRTDTTFRFLGTSRNGWVRWYWPSLGPPVCGCCAAGTAVRPGRVARRTTYRP